MEDMRSLNQSLVLSHISFMPSHSPLMITLPALISHLLAPSNTPVMRDFISRTLFTTLVTPIVTILTAVSHMLVKKRSTLSPSWRICSGARCARFVNQPMMSATNCAILAMTVATKVAISAMPRATNATISAATRAITPIRSTSTWMTGMIAWMMLPNAWTNCTRTGINSPKIGMNGVMTWNTN